MNQNGKKSIITDKRLYPQRGNKQQTPKNNQYAQGYFV
jgi:hypothetical protein